MSGLVNPKSSGTGRFQFLQDSRGVPTSWDVSSGVAVYFFRNKFSGKVLSSQIEETSEICLS